MSVHRRTSDEAARTEEVMAQCGATDISSIGEENESGLNLKSIGELLSSIPREHAL